MAVTEVGATTTDGGSGLSASSRTVSYTLNASANGIVVRLAWVGAPTSNMSSVTWNGTALTSAGTRPENGDGQTTEIWYLVSGTIDTGTHDVVVTGSANWEGIAICINGYSGFDTGTPVAGYAQSATGTASPITIDTAASATANDLVVDAVAVAFSVALTVDGSQSQDAQLDSASGGVRLAASNEAGAGGAVTMSWTHAGSVARGIAAVILKAQSGVTIAPGLGSQPITGRTPSMNFTIGMPDVP